jgi:hypothetical protein
MLIGNFEGGSADGWKPAWEGSPVLVAGSTIGVTRGSGSLRVTTNGGYYCLIWYASTVPTTLSGKVLTFDLSMIVSQAPGGWTKVADKIALNSNGPLGWREYGPASSRPTSITVTDKSTGLPSSFDWDHSWAGDVTKTFSVDISDYDLTGATWFQIIISIQGGDGVGHFFFDNAQIGSPTEVGSPSSNPPRLHVAGNRLKDPNGQTVVLRGVALIDLGFLQDWEGGATQMIDRLTDTNDTQGNSPGWYPKVVRIPVVPPDAASGWPHPFDPSSNDFNDLLRTVVDYCGQKGLYVIIDWHYVANTFDHIFSTSYFWEYIAPKFANDTHVMFELFNEPINAGATELDRWLSVRYDMQTWIDIVRRNAPDTIILVGGPSYSQIIGPTATYPVDGDNIAYVAHLYPGHWLSSSQSWYTNHITTAAAAHPVIVTEWGFTSDPNYDASLRGTITNYGNPLKDFLESYRIGMTAWVASYDWGPPMFNDDWTLRVGDGNMGGFAKDWLYDAHQALNVNSEEDDVNYTIIDMTITNCTVKAGKKQRRDSFAASGTFAAGVPDFDINAIEVRIVGDGNRIYTETIDINNARIVGNSLRYTGRTGAITSLRINLGANTFAIKAKNIDLTGLGCLLQLKFTLGSNRLSGQASEAVVNGAKIIPIRLMKTYKNTLVVTSARDVNNIDPNKLWDSFTVKGNIAVEDANDSNLVDTDFVVTWGAQTFTVPAESFTAKKGNRYTCKNAPASSTGLVNADINFDKCTFSIKVRNITLDVASGEIDFGLSFNYGYNETIQLNLR